MRILIAEDDVVTGARLRGLLGSWQYDVLHVSNGSDALRVLESAEPPALAILDWVMPELTGVEICRRVRERQIAVPTYILLLTLKDASVDIVAGLDAGADDYLSKPFDPAELRARLRAGERIVDLQRRLLTHVQGLEDALANVRRSERPASDLRLLQGDPRRLGLLAPGRGVRDRSLRSPVQPRYLPRLPELGSQAAAVGCESRKRVEASGYQLPATS